MPTNFTYSYSLTDVSSIKLFTFQMINYTLKLIRVDYFVFEWKVDAVAGDLKACLRFIS